MTSSVIAAAALFSAGVSVAAGGVAAAAKADGSRSRKAMAFFLVSFPV
jgi:hypothetical protein